jgi:tetratricopeptide (TPR) repeat protein
MGVPTVPPNLNSSVATPPGEPPSPEEFEDLLARTEALALRSDFDEAFVRYAELARLEPADAGVEMGWAWALILDEQPELALEHASRAVELDPLNPEAAATLARANLDAGDLERGLALALGAVELDQQSSLAHAVLAEAYLGVGKLADAVQEAELALSQDGGSAAAHRVRALLHQVETGNLALAVDELRQAVELQPELWLRHYELGLVLLQAGDYEAAVPVLKQALGLRPKADTYAALGEAYYHLGDNDRARISLEQALSAGATEPTIDGFLAEIHAREGRCEDASIYVDRALAQAPTNRLALEARQICLGAPPTPTPTTEMPSPEPIAEPSQSVPLVGHIAFPVWNLGTGQYDTYLSDLDGQGRRLVATGVHQPSISPDGEWLAVNGERDLQENILLVRTDGSEIIEITEHTEDSLPVWGPDGKHLAFSSTRHGDRQSRVYVIDPLPFDGTKAKGRALKAGPDDARGSYPAWTAGGQIVFSGCDYTNQPVTCGLLRMTASPGTHTPERVTTYAGDTAPAVHGDRIAFMSDRDGNWEVYVLEVDGSGLVRLTDSPAQDGLPAWSPDGLTIAYVSDEGGTWAVWAVDASGANRRKLFDIGGGGLAGGWQRQRISWGD